MTKQNKGKDSPQPAASASRWPYNFTNKGTSSSFS